MAESYWNMTYGDELQDALNHLPSELQKQYFLHVFNRMGNYVIAHEADGLTFREYFDMFER